MTVHPSTLEMFNIRNNNSIGSRMVLVQDRLTVLFFVIAADGWYVIDSADNLKVIGGAGSAGVWLRDGERHEIQAENSW